MTLVRNQSALSPQTWPFDLSWLPQPAYLVGGGVRDALRGQATSPYLDLDFVLPDQAVETAQAIARAYSAGFVLLDAQRQIARVVFGQATADFAQQMGSNLTSDLQRRDFTINAIAYNPHTQEIIDPLQGCADLGRGLIRMVCAQNLAADPLRLLRAYRQAAQLNYALEPETQRAIAQLASQLQQVAAERVRVEISYLLSSEAGTPWLTAAWQDGLLNDWFPAASFKSFGQIAALDRAANTLREIWPALSAHLLSPVNQRSHSGDSVRRTMLATAKLVALVTPNCPQAARDLERLKYSRAEINLVCLLVQFLPLQVESFALSRREQYFLFQKTGRAFPLLAVLAVAWGVQVKAIAPLIERFLAPNDPITHPVPLATGQDLMDILNLRPGPRIGQLLNALEIAQAEGKISTLQEALALARKLYSDQGR